MLSIDQIQSFTQVYKYGSYSEAARSIGKRRSTIREHIKTLEETINATLFIVEGRQVKPTKNADKLIASANNLSKMAEDFSISAMSLYDKPLHKLYICCDPLVPSLLIRDSLKAIKAKFPYLLIDVCLSSTHEAYDLIERNLCHIAILATQHTPQTKARLSSRYLGSLPICGYCGVSSELSEKNKVTLDDLRFLRQYQLDKTLECGLGCLMFSNKVEKVSSLELAVALLRDDGWMMLSKQIAQQWEDKGLLMQLNVDEVAKDYQQGVSLFYGILAPNVSEVNYALQTIAASAEPFLS